MKASYILASVALLGAGPVFAASFNCTLAKSQMEVLICSSAELSTLDERLAEAYRSALSRTSDRSTVIRWQREWLNSYGVTACKEPRCLAREFQSRIQLLTKVSAEDPSSHWTGTYKRVVDGKDDNATQLLVVRVGVRSIYVSGVSSWVGTNPGQINTGEIDGLATISGMRASFEIDECKGVLALRGARLDVESEDACGGMNVSFVGRYRRK